MISEFDGFEQISSRRTLSYITVSQNLISIPKKAYEMMGNPQALFIGKSKTGTQIAMKNTNGKGSYSLSQNGKKQDGTINAWKIQNRRLCYEIMKHVRCSAKRAHFTYEKRSDGVVILTYQEEGKQA